MGDMQFGIIGTNFISDWFVEACHKAGVGIGAVYSRAADTADAFANKHGIDGRFDDLEAMIDAVDAVYVASPMALHAEQTMAAIARGKHVLCEKTLGVNAAQTLEVIEAARAARVVVVEAVRPLYDPAFDVVRNAMRRIGPVRYAHFEKCQYSSRYDTFKAGGLPNAFDPGLGNSAVADIGIYCIAPMLDLFGTPDGVSGGHVLLGNGFDASGSVLFTYSTMVGTCVYSKVSSSTGPSYIQGEDGTIVIDEIANPGEVRLVPRVGDEQVLLSVTSSASGNMVDEVRAFARMVAAGEVDHAHVETTIASRRIMDAVLSS